ncbi:MAG TPA: hypothetical protein VKV20_08970 [Ktedonobacteraceae bacterium]|nr:hypothetical protein [Ktedonobacteraceae bacterium]
MYRLLFRLQAVKQQEGENFWQFFPTPGNHLVVEYCLLQYGQEADNS